MQMKSLIVEPRTVIGRKVKQLRKQGKTPASIYGHGVDSASIQMGTDAFTKVYQEAGETGLIELSLNNQKRPVLVKKVQVHAVDGSLIHVDFHQVNLKEKVHAQVPLELVGESPAVANTLGILLELTDELEVEALPTDLPEHIAVDVSGLAELHQVITVADLKLPAGITVLTAGETEIVKVGELVTKEAEEQAQADEAAAQTQAEGATPEGDKAPTDSETAEPAKETQEKEAESK